jgi:hypothetical protein
VGAWLRGRNWSTRCSSSEEAEITGRWVFTAAISGIFRLSFSTLATRLPENLDLATGQENLFVQSLMELAVVDSNPAVLRCVEDIGVTLPKANIGMIVGPSGMNRLRCNNVIPGHHNHK